MRDDRKPLLVETLHASRASHAAAVLLARVRSDSLCPIGRAARVALANACGESHQELSVQFSAPFRFAVAAPRPRLRVVQALGCGALERLFLNEYSLALVPPRAAPSMARTSR